MLQQGLLRVLLICPDPAVSGPVKSALAQFSEDVVLSYAASGYPSGSDLARWLRTFSPQAVFLSFEKPETAVAVMRYIDAEAEGLPVVGLHSSGGLALLHDALRAGTRDFLCSPFTPETVGEALHSARSSLRAVPLSYAATEHIYSFLPAKPGVGTSTVAMNVSAALARQPGMRVLLTDLDLVCGIVRFLLKLPLDLSIVDALHRAAEMDVSLWPQLVTQREGFDILHSGSINPQAYLDPAQVQGLIDFARCNYNALFFDLSGNMERHSLQVMQESKRVFVVCNPEPTSLFLGREKIAFLRTLGLADRTAAIINRVDQALAMPVESVATFLEVPIAATFADDPFWINIAVGGATTLVGDGKGRNCRLSHEFRAFARTLSASSRGGAPAPSEDQNLLAAA